jgi:iron complex transport system permease protein
MFILAVSKSEDLHGIVFWIMGSLDEPDKFFILTALCVSVFSLAVSYLFCLDLNAMELGEEEASHLGVNVEKSKKSLFLIAALLTGVLVSVSGIIGFIGLVVPHILRLLAGRDHRMLLAGSFLAGGGFLIGCDTIARTIISPVELPVGVITGIAGGSIFIYLLFKRQLSKE